MNNDIHNIHDKFVRASFMNPERAAAFFQQMLPEAISNVLSMETIEIIQES
ncbi:MAG: Rpn family recombination-promoting nuclease/putative transposase [Chitinophagales bacterium]|nr:Rpn family recombination-promoting nuclease/putative transposase [Chitinophagales bacterium]